jgi:hypothetical protein
MSYCKIRIKTENNINKMYVLLLDLYQNWETKCMSYCSIRIKTDNNINKMYVLL